MITLSPEIMRRVLAIQRGEATEHIVYERLAGITADPHNRRCLVSHRRRRKTALRVLAKNHRAGRGPEPS